MNAKHTSNPFWSPASPISQTQSWKIEYAVAKKMVVITAAGEIFREDARRQAEEASQLMRRHKVNRVLADFSSALVEISLTDLYWLPAYYSTLTASRCFQVAVVVPATGYRIESFKFYALRCVNSGFSVKLFAEPAAAEAWLQPAFIA